MKDAIAEEDKRKPLSDEKLGVLLNAKGYNIARRTVAKYREQLGIPWPGSAKNCDASGGPNRQWGLAPFVHAAADLGSVDAHRRLLDALKLGLFSYLFVLLFINTLAPAVSLWLLKRRGVISDLDIRNRSERPWPFLLVLAYYLMAYVLVVQSTAVVVPCFTSGVLLSLVVAIALALVGHLESQNQHAHARTRWRARGLHARGHDGPRLGLGLGVAVVVEFRTCGLESSAP